MAEGQERARDRGALLGRGLDALEARLIDLAPLGRPEGQVRITLNGTQHILEIVSDAGGHLAEGLHLLGLPQPHLGVDPLSELGIGKRPPAPQPRAQLPPKDSREEEDRDIDRKEDELALPVGLQAPLQTVVDRLGVRVGLSAQQARVFRVFGGVQQAQCLLLPALLGRRHRLSLDGAEPPGEPREHRQAGPLRGLLREP